MCLPVVLRDVFTIIHGPPIIPRLDRVGACIPNALSPDDVLELECAAVVHDPFGDFLAGNGGCLFVPNH